MNRFGLVFHPAWIDEIASRYDYPGEAQIIHDGQRARELGYYPYDMFVRLYRWKTRDRPVRHLAQTSAADVEAVTRIALDPRTPEWRRAAVLVALDGVGYPVASCVLTSRTATSTRSSTYAPSSPSTTGRSERPTRRRSGRTT